MSDYNKSADVAEIQLKRISPSMCYAKWAQMSMHLTNGTTHSCYHPPLHKIDVEEIKEPNLEDLEEEDLEEADAPSEEEEEEKEEIETESLEARVESEKKTVEEPDDAEGSFMSVDAAEKRNVKKSELKLDDAAADKEEDEFTCSICFLVLKNTQLAKPRSKVCSDCA